MKNKTLKKINGAGQTNISMDKGASVLSAKIIDNSKSSRVDGGESIEKNNKIHTTFKFGGINLGGD